MYKLERRKENSEFEAKENYHQFLYGGESQNLKIWVKLKVMWLQATPESGVLNFEYELFTISSSDTNISLSAEYATELSNLTLLNLYLY